MKTIEAYLFPLLLAAAVVGYLIELCNQFPF
jgi:hypothetical protein